MMANLFFRGTVPKDAEGVRHGLRHVIPLIGRGVKARKFQVASIEYLLRRVLQPVNGGVVLGDEPGAGKTFTIWLMIIEYLFHENPDLANYFPWHPLHSAQQQGDAAPAPAPDLSGTKYRHKGKPALIIAGNEQQISTWVRCLEAMFCRMPENFCTVVRCASKDGLIANAAMTTSAVVITCASAVTSYTNNTIKAFNKYKEREEILLKRELTVRNLYQAHPDDKFTKVLISRVAEERVRFDEDPLSDFMQSSDAAPCAVRGDAAAAAPRDAATDKRKRKASSSSDAADEDEEKEDTKRAKDDDTVQSQQKKAAASSTQKQQKQHYGVKKQRKTARGREEDEKRKAALAVPLFKIKPFAKVLPRLCTPLQCGASLLRWTPKATKDSFGFAFKCHWGFIALDECDVVTSDRASKAKIVDLAHQQLFADCPRILLASGTLFLSNKVDAQLNSTYNLLGPNIMNLLHCAVAGLPPLANGSDAPLANGSSKKSDAPLKKTKTVACSNPGCKNVITAPQVPTCPIVICFTCYAVTWWDDTVTNGKGSGKACGARACVQNGTCSLRSGGMCVNEHRRAFFEAQATAPLRSEPPRSEPAQYTTAERAAEQSSRGKVTGFQLKTVLEYCERQQSKTHQAILSNQVVCRTLAEVFPNMPTVHNRDVAVNLTAEESELLHTVEMAASKRIDRAISELDDARARREQGGGRDRVFDRSSALRGAGDDDDDEGAAAEHASAQKKKKNNAFAMILKVMIELRQLTALNVEVGQAIAELKESYAEEHMLDSDNGAAALAARDAFLEQYLKDHLLADKIKLSSKEQTIVNICDLACNRNNEKAIIFTPFVLNLTRLQNVLETCGGIKVFVIRAMKDGKQTPICVRQKIMDDFKAYNGGCVLIMSSKLGARSYNLDCANHVLFLDAESNPAPYQQALSRVTRFSDSPFKTVTFYNVLCTKTVQTWWYNEILVPKMKNATAFSSAKVAHRTEDAFAFRGAGKTSVDTFRAFSADIAVFYEQRTTALASSSASDRPEAVAFANVPPASERVQPRSLLLSHSAAATAPQRRSDDDDDRFCIINPYVSHPAFVAYEKRFAGVSDNDSGEDDDGASALVDDFELDSD